MAGPTTNIVSGQSQFSGVSNDVLIQIGFMLEKKDLNEAIKVIEEVKKRIVATEKVSRRFNFGWLSTMFFAMQTQRMFGSVLSSGIDTFTKIQDATYGSTTAVQGLNAAMSFLSFTIGDALNSVLEPILPTIIEMIEAFADFAQQHPEVVWLLIAGYIGSIAVSSLSQVMLLIQGLRQLGGDEGLITKLKNIKDFFTELPDKVTTVIDVVYDNLQEATKVFMAWYGKLPKELQIGIKFFFYVAIAEFFYNVGYEIGKATYEGFGKGLMELLNTNPVGKFFLTQLLGFDFAMRVPQNIFSGKGLGDWGELMQKVGVINNPAPTGTTIQGDLNIEVRATPGMDVEDVANKVIQKINNINNTSSRIGP